MASQKYVIPQHASSSTPLIRLLASAILILLGFVSYHSSPVSPQKTARPQQERVYAAAGFSVDSIFLDFYNKFGGVRIFGYPISDRATENGLPVQYFERQRLEYHRDKAGTPYEVQLSRLGALLAPQTILAPTAAATNPKPNQVYFRESRHSLSAPFLDYWKANGDVRIFGYPISEAVQENGRAVQYFERARMEYHPEVAAKGYGVELGLLGSQFLASQPPRVVSEQRIAPSSRGGAPGSEVEIPTNPAGLNNREAELIRRINAARKAAGAGEVTLDGTIRRIALARSQDMVDHNYFSHTAPDGSDFLSMLKAAKIPYRYAGEILANNNYGENDTALESYLGFMNSPHHHDILLDSRFTTAGVGEAVKSDGFHYYTVIFVMK